MSEQLRYLSPYLFRTGKKSGLIGVELPGIGGHMVAKVR
mgnify:CR=1 FL=1